MRRIMFTSVKVSVPLCVQNGPWPNFNWRFYTPIPVLLSHKFATFGPKETTFSAHLSVFVLRPSLASETEGLVYEGVVIKPLKAVYKMDIMAA